MRLILSLPLCDTELSADNNLPTLYFPPETPEEMLAVHQRLKLSAFERDLGLFIVTHREDIPTPHPQPLKPYQQLLADYRASKGVGRQFIVELLRYRGQHQLAAEFQEWKLPRFPVNGATLKVRADDEDERK